MLTRCCFQGIFKPIKHKVEELLSILLLSCISWASIELFEGEAELCWIVVVPLGKLEMGDQLLELMHHIVIDLVTLVFLQFLWFAVIDAE